MIAIKQVKDGAQRVFAASVFKNSDECVFGKIRLDALRQLHGPMMEIVVSHKSAGKADQNI